jgi:putative Ig domain-containing protein/beta-propeller repeat-containing protein
MSARKSRVAGRVVPALGLFCVAMAGRAASLDRMRLPLRFEENVGQADPKVRFLARGAGYGIYVTDHELVTALNRDDRPLTDRKDAVCEAPHCSRAVVRMRLLGSAKPSRVVAGEPLPGKSNYFIGNDPSAWRTDVPQYASVRLDDVYHGVDVVYRGVEGQLEYDFIVKSGGDPRRIRLRIEGGDDVRVDASGDLVVRTGAGELRQRIPSVYQDIAGERRAIKGAYRRIGRNDFAFQLGPYDSKRPLVIDPAFVFSTYLGGSFEDVIRSMRVDGSGNSYVAGSTSSTDFPATNPLYGTNAGDEDGFVAKIDSTGSSILWATYIGGSSADQLAGIAIDGGGTVYVTGVTTSTNFPTASPLHAANAGFADCVIAKLSSSGSALLFSTYLGGTSSDLGEAIAIDSSSNVYVAGNTSSTDFPAVNAIQGTYGGGISDAFVVVVNATGSAVLYATYLGGSGNDGAVAIVADFSGNAYVTGSTDSTNFPTAAALQGSNNGNLDAFISKINSAGSALTYSTYLGGSNADSPTGLAVDLSGDALIAGSTRSVNFPVASPVQANLLGTYDAFVSKLNAAGSSLLFSTYLGGQDVDGADAIAVDAAGIVHVAGHTSSLDFPTINPLQPQPAGLEDVFVASLDTSGSIVFSTYLGGTYDDTASAIAVDGSGNKYIAGTTASTNFPTQSPAQSVNAAQDCGFVMKITSTGTIALSPTVLADTISGSAYSAVLSASGGTGPYTFTVPSGGLPPGVTLTASTGTFTGAPAVDGRFVFTVRATDSLGALGDHRYVLNVVAQAKAPTGLAATVTLAGTVNVDWNPVVGASGYRVYRREPIGVFTLIASPSAPPFIDATVSSNLVYLYGVTAVGGLGVESAFSNLDFTNTYVFTDAPLAAGDTIKAVHITQLRSVITSLNMLRGQFATSFADSATAGAIVKASSVQELRTYADLIRAAFGLPPATYTNPVLTPGVSIIRASDLQQIRAALR